MEPTAETLEAIRELTRHGDTEIAVTLLRMSREVKQVCPECVGLSLAVVDDGFTFTVTSTHERVAQLDAVQYLDDGPCVTSASEGSPKEYHADDPVDEERWGLFARATAAAGVLSTLSLPILRHGRVVAGVNLYGATRDAFAKRHEAIADVCGAWAPGAVTDADLSFSTRDAAARTPERLRDRSAIDQAIGLLAAAHGLSAEAAVERLRQAADRAGISEAQAARGVIRDFTAQD